MINLEDKIFRYFQESIEITMHIGEKFIQEIVSAVDIISTSLLSDGTIFTCLLYTSPSPRDTAISRMPSSA